MVDDRLDATSYIMFRIIGMTPLVPPTPTMLMQMSAYFHGPHAIAPWLRYLSGEVEADLRSPAGRDGAAIELLIAAHALPAADQAPSSMVKQVPVLAGNRWNSAKSRSAGAAFRDSTAEIIRDLDLEPFRLAPRSYGPLDDRVTDQDGEGYPLVSRGAA